MASIAQYVIIERDSVGVTSCLRGQGDGWITHALVDGDVLALPAIGVSLSLSESYQDVAFALGE